MAKFFIGQRVRIRCAGSFSDGAECRIVAEGCDGYDEQDGWYVGYEVDIVGEGGATLCFEAHELEPILNSHEPCESDFKESLDKLLSEVICEAV